MREAENAIKVVHNIVPVLLRLHLVDDFNSELYHYLISDLHSVVKCDWFVVFRYITIDKSSLDYIRITGGHKRLFDKVVLAVILGLLLVLEKDLLVAGQIFGFFVLHRLCSKIMNK